MCGICGMVGIQDQQLLNAMCHSLIHRGPDDQGVYINPQAALGSRRLSIIDIAGGHQPISNEDNTLWIVFNGEIYNYRSLRSKLEWKGHQFKTNSDTEVVLHAYETYGPACVNYLNGMFAFAIWDEKTRQLFLGRDRLGIKPLYYWFNGEYLLFASEIKAILQDRRFQRKVNLTALYNYLSRLFVPNPLSIFEGIYKLAPGHTLTFFADSRTYDISQYWSLDFSKKLHLSESDYCEGILELLTKAVKRRTMAEVPIGAFLSGGVDSGSIVAILSQEFRKPIKSFSSGFEKTDTTLVNELPFAQQVAQHFGTEHFERTVTQQDILNALPTIVWHFDEPYAGGLPLYFLSSLASKHTKVVLNGLGGDELFGNYGRGGKFATRYINGFSQLYQHFPGFLQGMVGQAAIYQWQDQLTELVNKGSVVPELYVDWESPFSQEAKMQLCESGFLQGVDKTQTLNALFMSLYTDGRAVDFIDKITYLDMKTQLVDEYLYYTDILCMANSLESRVPYLDHELVEFAAQIPDFYRVGTNEPKYLLKKALQQMLPTSVLERPKIGFSLPINRWLHKDLNVLIDWLLNSQRIREQGYFRVDYIEQLITDFYAGRLRDYDYRLWNLLMFEFWHQLYIDYELSDCPTPGSLEQMI